MYSRAGLIERWQADATGQRRRADPQGGSSSGPRFKGYEGCPGAGNRAAGAGHPLPAQALGHRWANCDRALVACCEGSRRAGAAPLRAGAISPGAGHGAASAGPAAGDRGQHLEATARAITDRRAGRAPGRGARRAAHRAGDGELDHGRWTPGPGTKVANGVCTQIGNDSFAWFATTGSKSRLNFLDLLRARHTDYVINEAALSYMRQQALARPVVARLAEHPDKQFADPAASQAHLERLGLTTLTVTPDRSRSPPRARCGAASTRTTFCARG